MTGSLRLEFGTEDNWAAQIASWFKKVRAKCILSLKTNKIKYKIYSEVTAEDLFC